MADEKCPCPICGKIHLTAGPNKHWNSLDCHEVTLEDKIVTLTTRLVKVEAALAKLWDWQSCCQELPPDDVSDLVHAALVEAGIEVPK